MNEEQLLDQTTINERDLYSILTVTKYNLTSSNAAPHKEALNKILRQVQLVKEQCAGEGVYSSVDKEGRLESVISYGLAEYYYSTDFDDLAVMHGYNYVDLIVDILAYMKDGVLTNVHLYKRRNWVNKAGDPLLDMDGVTYKVGDDKYTVEDKDGLARLLDMQHKGISVEQYIDLISSAKLITNEVVEVDDATLVATVQDRLTGNVLTQQFKTVEDAVDFVVNNILIEICRIETP